MTEVTSNDRMPINIGHGHVWARPDGVKARCGGPGICSECSRDLANKQSAERRIDPNIAEVRAALSCWRQGTWSRAYAMEQFEKLLQGFVDRGASAHACEIEQYRGALMMIAEGKCPTLVSPMTSEQIAQAALGGTFTHETTAWQKGPVPDDVFAFKWGDWWIQLPPVPGAEALTGGAVKASANAIAEFNAEMKKPRAGKPTHPPKATASRCTRCGRTEAGCKDPQCPWSHLNGTVLQK